ncbi:MAG: hypothetical protein LBC92_05635 [Rickettsiales bacterium]|jgi:transcription-repair coupling factor (superfamily II helicase)|nr:hypothetical protein [Rickettsiales bacterium]
MIDIVYKVAHGRMHSRVLDEVVNDFYDGQFNVLISTTIVESGLDIPDANTIIIYRANMFGLSQLHQLRGRVGRGKIKGYAYFFTSSADTVTETSIKRLRAIENSQNVGAGFAIASSDMDIRGSGNLIGEEQSGHIRDIGIELYNQMLVEEINKIKNNYKSEEYDFISCVKLNVLTSLSEYIKDMTERLYYYRKISENRENVLKELESKFGEVPQEVSNLIEILKIKDICKTMGIINFEYDNNMIGVTFYKDNFYNADILINFIKNGKAKLIKQNVIGFFIDKSIIFQESYRILGMLKQ